MSLLSFPAPPGHSIPRPTMAAAAGEAPRALSQKEQDIQMMLAANVHLGTKNCDFHMEYYAYKCHSGGIYIVNLGKTWEKLQLAARACWIIRATAALPCRGLLDRGGLVGLLRGVLG
ncbi:hypothetical protein ZWY2020_053428 [Hordeum vulgare]|nr:hypothetical protein ZWY2020_053428 [Hordeum vulgare]